MIDHHVDRPGVYGRQRVKLTGPNRPIELRSMSSGLTRGPPCMEIILRSRSTHQILGSNLRISRNLNSARTRMGWTTWWLWRGACTRSHPELGRENPQRPWYCASRHGRVGRRQVFQSTQYRYDTPRRHRPWEPPRWHRMDQTGQTEPHRGAPYRGQHRHQRQDTHPRGVEQPGSSSGS